MGGDLKQDLDQQMRTKIYGVFSKERWKNIPAYLWPIAALDGQLAAEEPFEIHTA